MSGTVAAASPAAEAGGLARAMPWRAGVTLPPGPVKRRLRRGGR